MRNLKQVISLVICVMLTAATAMAQDTCFAKAPSQVPLDKPFQYTVSVNHQGEIVSTDFGKFELVSGPSMGTSTSISMMNGHVEQNTTYTYTYYLSGHKEGTFTIPGVSLSIDGKIVATNSVTVTVSKSANYQDESRSAWDDMFPSFDFPQWGQPQEQPSEKEKVQVEDKIGKNDIFIKATSSKLEAFQGEGIVVTYRLYVKDDISGYSVERASNDYSEDFWIGSLDLPRQERKTETINGKNYTVFVFDQAAFYPTKTGKLTIPKLNVNLSIRVPAVVKDPFWGNISSYRRKEISLSSNDLTVKVKALPGGNPNKTEVVGGFTMTSNLSRTECHPNERLVYSVTISGSGNLHQISADDLDITFPDDCDVTYPKVVNNITAKGDYITGTKTFQFTIIPHSEGTYYIPSASYYYYDYDTGSHKIITSQDYNIEVTPGPARPSEDSQKSKNNKAKTYKI
ncbi:MAG: BatD family protein [Bacteroidales bacterium]|nr:BatD family protein [Bacteroidales bacterium]